VLFRLPEFLPGSGSVLAKAQVTSMRRRAARSSGLAPFVWAVVALGGACGGDTVTTAPPPTTPPAAHAPSPTITVSPTDVSIEVGHTIQLSVTVTDASGQPVANPEITWSTSDTSQAWVREDGLVTGAGPGRPSVIATSGERRDRRT